MKKSPVLSKTIIVAFAINAIQLISITSLAFLHVSGFYSNADSLSIFIIIIIALLNSGLSIKYTYSQKQTSTKNEMLTESINQIQELNKALRAQRHDFINHLQVVHSLIEFEEYSETKKYIEKVYSDIQRVSKVMRTSIPAVNALLQAKLLYCEKHNIQMSITINSSIENLAIPAWELCRVLGNLIDNGVYATKDNTSTKQLDIEIGEDIKFYYFVINDNGKGIEPEISNKIFEEGFTTKDVEGHGMGLAIVKDIVESFGGSIDFTSVKGKTSFMIKLPKPTKNQNT